MAGLGHLRKFATPPGMSAVGSEAAVIGQKADIRVDGRRFGNASGSTVVSDGLSCFNVITEVGCDHHPMITGGGPQAVKLEAFKWVNTTLGTRAHGVTPTTARP